MNYADAPMSQREWHFYRWLPNEGRLDLSLAYWVYQDLGHMRDIVIDPADHGVLT